MCDNRDHVSLFVCIQFDFKSNKEFISFLYIFHFFT